MFEVFVQTRSPQGAGFGGGPGPRSFKTQVREPKDVKEIDGNLVVIGAAHTIVSKRVVQNQERLVFERPAKTSVFPATEWLRVDITPVSD